VPTVCSYARGAQGGESEPSPFFAADLVDVASGRTRIGSTSRPPRRRRKRCTVHFPSRSSWMRIESQTTRRVPHRATQSSRERHHPLSREENLPYPRALREREHAMPKRIHSSLPSRDPPCLAQLSHRACLFRALAPLCSSTSSSRLEQASSTQRPGNRWAKSTTLTAGPPGWTRISSRFDGPCQPLFCLIDRSCGLVRVREGSFSNYLTPHPSWLTDDACRCYTAGRGHSFHAGQGQKQKWRLPVPDLVLSTPTALRRTVNPNPTALSGRARTESLPSTSRASSSGSPTALSAFTSRPSMTTPPWAPSQSASVRCG